MATSSLPKATGERATGKQRLRLYLSQGAITNLSHSGEFGGGRGCSNPTRRQNGSAWQCELRIPRSLLKFSHRYIPADADRQPRCQRLVSPLSNPSQYRLFNLPEWSLYGMDDKKRRLERWSLFSTEAVHTLESEAAGSH